MICTSQPNAGFSLWIVLWSAMDEKKTEHSGASAKGKKSGDKKKPDSKAEVCKPHKNAKDQCFICDPKLREKGRLWCKEHERYENRCWVCHPEAQDKKRLFCKEHSLYEDECFICHPELKKKPADKAK